MTSPTPTLTDEKIAAEYLRWNLPGNDAALAFHKLDTNAQVRKAFVDGLKRGIHLAANEGAPAAAPAGEFSLVRSIIHDCLALKLPQTFAQRLGMMAQIVPLKGLSTEQAQAIVERLNASPSVEGVGSVPLSGTASPFEARRWCKGDGEWSNWQPCTKEQADDYRAQGMQVRERAAPASPSPAEQLRETTAKHGHCASCSALHPQHHAGCSAASPSPAGQPIADFCDTHCTWLDHHPDCERANAGVRAAPVGPLRYVDAPKALQDALIAYHARPCDDEAGAIVRAVLDAYGVAAPPESQQESGQ